MKKIYLFLAMLLGIFGSHVLSAQEEHTFSRTESIQIGPALNAIEPNTWYFMHQGRPYNVDGALDHQVVLGEVPSGEGGVMSEKGLNENIMKEDYTLFTSPVPAKTYAGYVVRFIPVSGKEGAYLIQFGTGHYMSGPAGSGNSQNFKAMESIYDAGEFNIYYINDASYVVDDNHPNYACFGFNVYNMGQRVDNNGTGTALVTWGSGKREKIEAGNSIWNVHEVIWDTADELEALLLELETIWSSHESDIEYYNENIGTQPGQYPADVVNAFLEAMQFGYDLLDDKIELTIENMEKAIADIASTYQAVVAAKIPYIPADGYYRLRSGMTFTQNNETFVKYMYTAVNGTTINARWQTPADLSTDATVLWKLTKQEDGYDFVNVATDARFNNVATSTAVTLSSPGTNLMAFDVAAIVGDITYVNVRVATQAANNFYYLHTNGHNSGAGVSGNIVGWERSFDSSTGSAKGSEWVLEPVSEADVATILEAYEIVKNREKMENDYQNMVSDANSKLMIAKDYVTDDIDEESPIVSNDNPITSPCSDSDEGLNIEYLWDQNATTFWHSDWHDNYKNEPHHYIQIEMVDEVPSAAAFQFTRRDNSGNQIKKWSVYGFDVNNFDLKQADGELLATIETPFSSQTETLTSDAFMTKGHKYLRFYCEATSSSSNSKFFHIAEFQLYPATILDPETSQYHMMGAVVTNLEKVLSDQAAVTSESLTLEQFNALKTAYDAFIAKFVDPMALRHAITAAEGKVGIVAIGTQPGFWPVGSSAAQVSQTVVDAKAYDAAGVYTAAQSQAFIDNLQGNLDNLFASAIPVETGKWYRIRFGSADEFEERGWGTDPGEYGTKTTYKEVEYETSEPLWDKYVVVAEAQDGEVLAYNDETGKAAVTRLDIVPAEAEQVTVGHNVRLDDEDDIKDAGLSYFRFVEVGDSAYALQNKATGLFIKAAGTDGAVTLDFIPSLFNVRPVGYGYNLLASRSLLKGANENYLHAQVAGNLLVTWEADELGTRSCLLIEEAEDVEPTYDGSEFKMNMLPGSISALCYPVDIAAEEGLYGVNEVEVDAVKNDVAITLVSLQEADAGRPFIIIPGGGEAVKTYNPEAEEEPVTLRHGYTFVTEPQASNILKGTFTDQTVGYGVVVPEENGFVVAKQTNASVSAFHAWISGDEKYDREATASFVISGDADGIAASMQKVAKSGAIYTLDGRLVTKSGNLNSLRGMAPGIYIVNGVKVTIK